VRWITTYARAHGVGEGLEKAAVQMVIVLLVALTATAAWILTRIVQETERLEVRGGVPVLCVAAAIGAVWIWMTPSMLKGESGGEVTAGTRFTFGPYPDEDRLIALKAEGYTAVVPLLHPAVIPFEPELLRREREAAARAGLEVIHLPMLPWVSENREALDRVRELVASGQGRYYVHCYLGMDRVQLVRKVVDAAGGGGEVTAISEARGIATQDRWERGEVVHLDPRVHLTPFPTDAEMLRYLAASNGVHVVSLLDPAVADDRPWIAKEQQVAAQWRVAWTGLPIPEVPFDAEAALRAARAVRDLPGTILVHDFLSPASGRSPAAEGFVQAWRTGRPPLPLSLLRAPLAGGALIPLAPHAAIGPTPEPEEFDEGIARRGVRVVIRLGGGDEKKIALERKAAKAAGMRWERIDRPDLPALLERLSQGGPFYLYGAEPAGLADAMRARFGPPSPAARRDEAAVLFAAVEPMAGGTMPKSVEAHVSLPPPPAGMTPPRDAGPQMAEAMPTGAAPTDAAPAGATASAAAPERADPSGKPRTGLVSAGVAGASPSGAGTSGATPPRSPTATATPAVRRFLGMAIPDLTMWVLLGPFFLLFAAMAAGAAAWLRVGRGLPVAYSRKGFHFMIFTMAGVVQALGGLPAVMLYGGVVSLVVLYAVARGPGFPFYEAMARPSDAPRRTLFIMVPLLTTALGGILANVFFGAWAIVGYMVGGWGDAVGEPVGAKFGRHRYRVPSLGGVPAMRSLEGSAAVLVAGMLAAYAGLVLRGVDPARALLGSVACAAVGALVEAFSTHGVDNLTVQVAASGAAFFLFS